MPQTAAQRQAAYRARRHDGEGEVRLNTWIASPAHCALTRLARHHGLTRRALVERLLLAADDAILRTLDLDTPAWDAYFGVTASRPSLPTHPSP